MLLGVPVLRRGSIRDTFVTANSSKSGSVFSSSIPMGLKGSRFSTLVLSLAWRLPGNRYHWAEAPSGISIASSSVANRYRFIMIP